MRIARIISILFVTIILAGCQRKSVDHMEDKTPVNTGPTPETTTSPGP